MKIKAVGFVMVMVFLVIATGFITPVGRWQITSAAVSTAFPQGSYTTELTRSDLPAAFPPQFVPLLVGRWESTFAEGGSHTVIKDGQVVVEGRYAATQNQIAFYSDTGLLGCDSKVGDTRPFIPPGYSQTAHSGTYTWAFDGRTLTFARIADDCGGRILVFTSHPLVKRR